MTKPQGCRDAIGGNHRGAWVCAAVALLAMALAGCGEGFPDTVSVRGRVRYQGKPVSQGTVTFHPATLQGATLHRPAVGMLEDDGTYRVQTFRRGDGVMPGNYVVVIRSFTGGPTEAEPDRPRNWLIPEKYGSAATSDLTATIPADASGRLERDFDLQ